ncbi:MAG: hypothetical protein RL375_1055 [Pseudomonadota bacterium]|jgi:hypothetical protein
MPLALRLSAQFDVFKATMSASLIKYEAARTALAEAHRVDEVKDIRDKAEAMAAYARQAKDSELIQYATEIKVRAERRCGELLARTEKSRGAAEPGTARGTTRSNDATASTPTLAQMGLTKDESSRYQQLAAMPADHFETAVATAKATAGEVTTAFMLREAKRMPAKKMTQADQRRLQDLNAAKARGTSMLSTYARLLLQALRAQSEFTQQERELLAELAGAIHSQGLST